MFDREQKVVYPMQGVGKIRDIQKRQYKGEYINYYEIYFPFNEMTFMVPVDKVEELGIRPLVDRDKVEEVFSFMNHVDESCEFKKIKDYNLDLLKKGDILSTAKIYKSLYTKSTIKELPFYEKKMLDDFEKLLEHEISFALNISFEETRKKIQDALMQSLT